MKQHEVLIWAIAVLVALRFGIFAGAKVMSAYKDAELMDARAALDCAQASLAEANIELERWKQVLKSLADGDQLDGVDFGRRLEDELVEGGQVMETR